MSETTHWMVDLRDDDSNPWTTWYQNYESREAGHDALLRWREQFPNAQCRLVKVWVQVTTTRTVVEEGQ